MRPKSNFRHHNNNQYTSFQILELLHPKYKPSCPKSQSNIRDFSFSDEKTSKISRLGSPALVKTPRSNLDLQIGHHQIDLPKQNSYPYRIVDPQIKSENKSSNKLKQYIFDKPISFKQKTRVKRFEVQNCPQTQKIELMSLDKYDIKMVSSIIIAPDSLNSPKLSTDDPLKSSNRTSLQISPANKIKPELNKNQFKKIQYLGKGKFGVVHLVRHNQTGFICAMKILNKTMLKQQKMEKPLIRELRIHNKLYDMNVVNFYGFFDDDQSIYILLEYCVDGPILSQLKNRNRFEEEEISELIRGISLGVKHIHENNCIHRDLKPQNIVMSFNVPKICDFGWANQCSDYELCKSYCGTPLYLSPQMIKKQYYGPSVDIWAIGLLTYQLLVGRVAFNIWNEKDFQLVLQTQPKIPVYIDRSLSCEDFINQALQKNPHTRMSINEILKHKFVTQKQPRILENLFYQTANRIILNDFQQTAQ